MTTEPEPWRHPAFPRPKNKGGYHEPRPTAWSERWERDFRHRWQRRPGQKGLYPVPTEPIHRGPHGEVRGSVTFFFLIVRKAQP